MLLDVPLALSFMYIFFIHNIFGWGWLHEKPFLLFCSTVGLLYLLVDGLPFIRHEKVQLGIKTFLLLLFMLVAVGGTTWNLIGLRNRSLDSNYISDSGLQVELAGKFILEKENPYVKDYDATTLAKWPYADEAGRTVNPALYHNVIPPFLIFVATAGFRVFSRFFGFFDIRLVYLVAYVSLIILGWIKYRLHKQLLLFLILVCMNPLFILNLIKGTNDVVVVALLLWSLFFLEKNNSIFSAILLGIAFATKQTAWFAAPFYFLYSYQLTGKKGIRLFSLISILVGFAFYAPFLLDNFDRTFRSIIFYPTSHTSGDITTHPIEGFGFGQIIYTLGWVPSIYTNFPFWLFQLLCGGIMIIALFLRQRKHISGSTILSSIAVLTGIVWFFNRYFLESHLAYLLVLLAAASLWQTNTDTLPSNTKKRH